MICRTASGVADGDPLVERASGLASLQLVN